MITKPTKVELASGEGGLPAVLPIVGGSGGQDRRWVCSWVWGREGKSTEYGRGVWFKGKGGGTCCCWFFFMFERCSSHESGPDSTRFLSGKSALREGVRVRGRSEGEGKGCV